MKLFTKLFLASVSGILITMFLSVSIAVKSGSPGLNPWLIPSVFVAVYSSGLWLWFKKHQAYLSNYLFEISALAETNLGASDQIELSSSQITESSVDQGAALQQAVASIDEISAMVTNNVANAEHTQQTSVNSQSVAHKGLEAIEQLSLVIQDIKESNAKTIAQINNGNEQIQGIVKIVGEIKNKTQIINDIVFQTKLLSFNASVEAARAGEQGKGFSVVAAEIGKLAQVSGAASKEISELLVNSVNHVNQIVDEGKKQAELLMDESGKNLKRGLDTADMCRTIFGDVVSNSDQVTSLVTDITAASKEQAQGVHEVTKAISSINESNQKNALVSSQTQQISNELNLQTKKLLAELKTIITNVCSAVQARRKDFARFIWADKLSVGVQAMDNEHKVLIERINDFTEGLNKSVSDQEKLVLFDSLASYATEHFDHEEKYLQSIGYPEFSAHQKIHRVLLGKVGDFRSTLVNNTLNESSLITFLQQWLVSHIMGIDAKYGEFSHSRKFSK